MSSYVCREHPSRPVDHRGRGCVACRDERRQRGRLTAAEQRKQQRAQRDARWAELTRDSGDER